MEKLRGLLLVALFAFIAGCAATGEKYSDMQSSIPALAADKGRIYFYRTSSLFGGGLTSDIQLNGEVVGRSVRGSFFYVDRPAGDYEVMTATEAEKKWKFKLKAGETKYVKTSASVGVLVGRIEPEVVDPVLGASELSSLAYVESPVK